MNQGAVTREVWDGTKKAGGKPCIDMKGQPEVVLTSFQERKYGHAPPERKPRSKPYWKIMNDRKREREEEGLSLDGRTPAASSLVSRHYKGTGCPGEGWVAHQNPGYWWHAARQIFYSEAERKYYVLEGETKYTEIDLFHQPSAYSFTISCAACSKSSKLTKSVQINDIHAVAPRLKVHMQHLDEPASLHAVFRSEGAEILAKNLHMKLFPLLAAFRGPWPSARAAQALLTATQELVSLDGVVDDPDIAIALILGTSFVCATMGKAIVRTEHDGIISGGTAGPVSECMPHLATAEIGYDFLALLGIGITPDQMETATESCEPFGYRRPRAWASAVLGMSTESDGVVMGISTAEKAMEKPGGPAPAAKKPKIEPTRIRCRHILLKHVESRSTIDKARAKRITRTKFDAENEIRALLAEILADDTRFSPLARQHSECSSAMKGGDQSGDLGWFSRGKMQKPFEDEAFSLEVGQISDMVASESGIHIIQRIA
eukprot:GEMP01041654.1.p1 GENE.GEMP01041654.1~~GEMP01041654.1.p1  ORF type:complete len:489 (+),score=95.15 GEMP01041654.1:44-1510(+)